MARLSNAAAIGLTFVQLSGPDVATGSMYWKVSVRPFAAAQSSAIF